MEIILVKDVDKLGMAGQTLHVADGYARNFLLPTGVALPATEGNLKMLAKKRAEYEARAKAERERAEELRHKLAATRLVFHRKAGEKDKLYGAVTAIDLAEALQGQGLDIDRKRLRLSEPIKALGEYEIPVRLHAEITATFKVSVQPEEGAAEPAAAEPPKEEPQA